MKILKIICIVPFIVIGYPFGFIFEALSLGFIAGTSSVIETGDEILNGQQPGAPNSEQRQSNFRASV